MATRLTRRVDPKTRAPVPDHKIKDQDGNDIDAAFYFVECDQCGPLFRRGLSRRAAEMQAAAHHCR